jgi:putative FmdB family regulatory protein
MPTYEFECKRCNKIYEVKRPITESDKPYKCGLCNVECDRILSSANFILKGSGWPGQDLKRGNNGPNKSKTSER